MLFKYVKCWLKCVSWPDAARWHSLSTPDELMNYWYYFPLL